MFASRQEDGVWFLCHRRGRLIKLTSDPVTREPVPCIFSSGAKGKLCADELNEKYLDEYELYYDRDYPDQVIPTNAPQSLRIKMVDVIKKYNSD